MGKRMLGAEVGDLVKVKQARRGEVRLCRRGMRLLELDVAERMAFRYFWRFVVLYFNSWLSNDGCMYMHARKAEVTFKMRDVHNSYSFRHQPKFTLHTNYELLYKSSPLSHT